jgi:hypothetical protein
MNASTLVFLGAWALCLCAGQPLWAQYTLQTAQQGTVPGGIGYQGRLEFNGVPVIGTKNMQFRLYGDRDGGTLLWPNPGDADDGKRVVSFTQGIFGVSLNIPLTALVGSRRKYLEVQVGDDVVLAPRDPLLSVPYAKVAQTVEGTIDISTGGLVVQNTGGVVLHVSSLTARVGIGTTAPNARLSVSSSVASGTASILELANPAAAAGTAQRIVFNFDPDGKEYQHAALEAARTDGAGTAHLGFYTRPGGGGPSDPVLERMRLTGDGRLGIGTTSPQAPLDVSANTVPGMVLGHASRPQLQFQVAGSSMLVVEHDGTVGRIAAANSTDLVLESDRTERVRVKAGSGYVGIGTTDPQAALHVNGAFLGTDVIQTTADGNVSAPAVTLNDSDTGLYRPLADTIGIVTNGAERVRIDPSGRVAIGTDLNTNGMRLRVTGGDMMVGNVADTSNGTALPDLFVQGNMVIGGQTYMGPSRFDRLGVSTETIPGQLFKVGAGTFTVLDTGRVGIGTTDPAFPLDIQATVVPGLSLDHAANPQLLLRTGSTPRLALQYSGAAGRIGTSAASGDLVLATDDTERARITATGRLGIGTTDPQQPLHVVGNAQVSGTLTLTSTPLGVLYGGTGQTTDTGVRTALDLAKRDGTNVQSGSTWDINITGNANTADRLTGPTTDCGAGLFPKGVDQYGNVENCVNPVDTVEDSVEAVIYDNDNTLAAPWSVAAPDGNNITFDGGTFFIDVTQNRVGISSSAPSAALSVQGSVNVSGKLKEGGADLVPAGLVMFFNLASCPAGWTELNIATGRAVVGTPSGGTTGAYVGTALNDIQVLTHTHSLASHTHGNIDPDGAGHSHAMTHSHGTLDCDGAGGHSHDMAHDHGNLDCDGAGGHTHGIGSHLHSVNPPATDTDTPSATAQSYAQTGNSYGTSAHTHGVNIGAFNSAAATGDTGNSNLASVATGGASPAITGAENLSAVTTPGSSAANTGAVNLTAVASDVPSTNNSGATSHTMPYIQLKVCQKN